MIQINSPDWHDNARANDTIDTMDEEYGYFTTISEAKAFANLLQEQEDRRHKDKHEATEKASRIAWERNDKELQALIKAGLRPSSALRPFQPLKYARPWHATTYTVLEISPNVSSVNHFSLRGPFMAKHRIDESGYELRVAIEELAAWLYEEPTPEQAKSYGLHDESVFDYQVNEPNRVMRCYAEPYKSWDGYTYQAFPPGFYHCDSASIYTNMGRIGV